MILETARAGTAQRNTGSKVGSDLDTPGWSDRAGGAAQL